MYGTQNFSPSKILGTSISASWIGISIPGYKRRTIDRDVKFSRLVCDGDNKTHAILNAANIYEGMESPYKNYTNLSNLSEP